MFFTVKPLYKSTKINTLFILKTLTLAKTRIVLYKFGATEKKLNSYLLKKYNTSLKIACLCLLTKASFTKNYAGEIIIVFKDKKYDRLAQIITYGTEYTKGSKILKYAFS